MLLTFALLIANLGLDVGYSYSQRSESDGQLRTQAAMIAQGMGFLDGRVTYLGGPLPSETSGGLALNLAVVGPQGLIGKSETEPVSDLILIDIAQPVLRSGQPVWADLYDARHVHRRVYAVPVSSSVGPSLVLVASTPLVPVESSTTRAMLLLAFFSLLVLILGGAAVYLLVGRVLRPVVQVARLADSMNDRELHRRVDVSATDDELGILVRTINRMLGRLQTSFEALRRFTADASHELRAPLAIIATEVEVVLNSPRKGDEYVRVLRLVESEVAEMTRMIEKLLLLARADAGELQQAPREIDVADFVQETAARWIGPAARIDVRIEVGAPDSGVMEADPDLSRRVLDNLIDNALRHSPPGGTVRLQAGCFDGDWVFEVRDQGPGVPRAERERIFLRFARDDSARSRNGQGGAGLGLALSAAFADVQGGRLTIEDEPGWGATFRLTLRAMPGGIPGGSAATGSDSATPANGVTL